ncbi:MAG: ROK family protein [Lachnospiraceae bacterium]|nr:ROK family protein [Lachnospiraceae bacterium]
MMINDLLDIRAKNTKLIINALRFQTMLTKKEIADLSSLSFATVSNLSNDLKAMNIFVEAKLEEKRVGRNPNILTLNQTQFLAVALDLQLENTLGFAIVNLQDKILYQKSFDISDLKTPAEIVQFAKKIFDEFVASYPEDDLHFIGIGAAVPAVFDATDGKLALSAVPVYENAPLKTLLSETFSMTVYVDNIANICALSAYIKQQDLENIVCMDISQGVGVGVIANGHLLRGKNGYATEVAHVPIGDPKLQCPYCGCYGCIETELSLSGMMRYFSDIPEDLPLLERWKRFAEKVSEENEKTEQILCRIGSLMGQLATILINMFDPEIFYISGYIVDIFDKLKPYFDKETKARCNMLLNKGLKIETLWPQSLSNEQVYKGLSDALYELWYPIV